MFSIWLQIRTTIADIAIASVAGAFWTLAFEYPGMNLEQTVFGGVGEKGSNNKTEAVLQKADGENISQKRV